MDEAKAAKIIQKVWRGYYYRKSVIESSRNEFMSLCSSLGDINPEFNQKYISNPQFKLSDEYLYLQTQSAIANRLSHLKYQKSLGN